MSLTWWIIIGFGIAMTVIAFIFRKTQRKHALASILTILGVLGTFLGITIGLLGFDPQDIEASIPILLGGLKIAFITSIMGILLSLILKVRNLYHYEAQKEDQPPLGATIDNIVEWLCKIYTVQSEEGTETSESLHEIERALTGDGESTVVTQLQKLRTSFLDKQDDMLRAFNEFASKMAGDSSRALIKALEEVMKDFNAKINEQFGDNFKQLNEAVGKILVWQEQYRQQMDELAHQFQTAAESIEQSRSSLSAIAEQSSVIQQSAEHLEPVLAGIQEQQQLLAEHLDAFSSLSQNAREAFPIIEGRLNQLTTTFSDLVERAVKKSYDTIEYQNGAMAEQVNRLEAMARTTNDGLQTTIAELRQQIETLFRESANRIESQLVRLDTALEEELTKALKALDGALEQELSQSLKSLGRQLGSLSRRFVEDYTPLTDKLREVVEIANSLPRIRQREIEDQRL